MQCKITIEIFLKEERIDKDKVQHYMFGMMKQASYWREKLGFDSKNFKVNSFKDIKEDDK